MAILENEQKSESCWLPKWLHRIWQPMWIMSLNFSWMILFPASVRIINPLSLQLNWSNHIRDNHGNWALPQPETPSDSFPTHPVNMVEILIDSSTIKSIRKISLYRSNLLLQILQTKFSRNEATASDNPEKMTTFPHLIRNAILPSGRGFLHPIRLRLELFHRIRHWIILPGGRRRFLTP